MNDLNIRIIDLKPMRVARVRVISETPERDAWEKLRAWAKPKGLLDTIEKHPVFGFNNPAPSPDRKEYGYEFWICIEPDIEPEGEIEVKEFSGGLYAVTTCEDLTLVGENWKRLWEWVQSGNSGYKWRKTHELEKPMNPCASEKDLVLDLYLPIQE